MKTPLGISAAKLAVPAFAAATALAGCDSGLGHDPRLIRATQQLDEAIPESLTRFGVDFGVGLVDPNTGLAAPPREHSIDGSSIAGLGSVVFVGFTTPAAADDADGQGGDLDPSAPGDTNDADDVFVAALLQGTVRDVALVSSASGGAAAATGASGRSSVAFEVNAAFDPNDAAATNPAGWVHVAFVSSASNIVGAAALDHNGGQNDVIRATVAVNVVPAGVGSTIDLVRVNAGPLAPQYLSAPNGAAGTAGGSTSVSDHPVLVESGDLVAFDASNGNLVAGDLGSRDVFLRKPSVNLTFRVTAANGDSERPALTDDVVPVIAFESLGSNFSGVTDTNGRRDVYFAALAFVPGAPPAFSFDPFRRASVRDGNLEAHNGDSRRPSVHVITADVDNSNGPDGADGDGRIDQVQIAFESDSNDIVAAIPPNSTTNVYLYDNRLLGRTLLLNQRVGPGGATLGSADGGASPCDSFHPAFMPSGNAVAFETLADNLDSFLPTDGNDAKDVVIADIRQAFVSGTLRVHRLSVTTAGGDANGASSNAVFGTVGGAGGASGGVTPYFSQGLAGLMTADRCAGCHSFLTGNPSFNHAGNDFCDCTDCHGNVGDTGDDDIWTVPPASLDFRGKSADVLCAQVRDTPNDRGDVKEHLKHDGRIVWALVDASPFPVHHLGNPTLTQQFGLTRSDWDALVDAWVDNGFQCRPFGSGTGDVILFETTATNLGNAAGGTAIVGFPETVTVERMSKTSGFPPTGGKQSTRASFSSSITRDDRFVVFVTSAALDPARDGNNTLDVYVRDLLLGTTTLVSRASGPVGIAAAGVSTHPSAAVDPNGNLFVAFESTAANLVAGFVNGNGAAADVYVADFSTFDGVSPATIGMTLASANSANPVRGGNGGSGNPALAAYFTGPIVAFESTATDLIAGFVDHNGAGSDVFVNEIGAGGMELVSSQQGSAVDGGNASSSSAAISDDGQKGAFASAATDLLPGFVDHNGAAGTDVFARFFFLGSIDLVSHADASSIDGGNGSSTRPTMSGDGAVVAYQSLATDLMPGFVDGNGAAQPDVFVVFPDPLTFTPVVELVSQSTGPGDGGNGASRAPNLSSDGNLVAFETDASDLLAGDANGDVDCYLRDLGAGTTRRISIGLSGLEPQGDSLSPHIGSDAGQLVFESLSDDLIGVNIDTNGVSDVYRVQR